MNINYKQYSKRLEQILFALDLPEPTRILVDRLVESERAKVHEDKNRYIRVEWPDAQYFMDDERWERSVAYEDGSYLVPEDLYYSIVLDKMDKESS